MLEIRGHARGGQGMVTAFEILAKIFSKLGDYQVQAFPAFGVERTGAPVQAFLRIAHQEIHNRSNIYNPHLVVVFDESLLEQVPVFEGLHDQGAVLLNTTRPREAFSKIGQDLYTVPATDIAIRFGVGSKALPIVNAAMIGAMIRIFDTDPALAKRIVQENVPAKPHANAQTTMAAYKEITGPVFPHTLLKTMLEQPFEEMADFHSTRPELTFSEPDFEAPYWSMPLSKNKTGNWRLLKPAYANRVPPCHANCPAGTDVREFVKLASEKKFEKAGTLLLRHNPFPSICGRVCPHFCEQNCNRNELDSGVNIGAIERFIGDRILELQPEQAPIRYEEKIAVIGSGPAGLTAAIRLREKGYPVDVFEALSQAGGMMRSGIPKFRLPDEVLNLEIRRIEKSGVNIHLNRKVTIEELAKDYHAIITALGSHIGSSLNLENDDLLIDGINFLRTFKLGSDNQGIEKGHKVAVIGGGNTAIDVARTALRLGAEPTIYYRRTLKEMPAIAQEVEEAMAEGVKFEFLTIPLAIKYSHTDQTLIFQRMELGEPDESGRAKPVPIEGSTYFIHVDKVIKAIGQSYDSFALGSIAEKPVQGKFSVFNGRAIFGAGDMAWGGTVTEAIGSGNQVAEEVHLTLRGFVYQPDNTKKEVVTPEELNLSYYLPTPRHREQMRQPKNFYLNFREVNTGLSEEDIVAESGRCLHCGDCFLCGNCFNFCPDAAIHMDESGRIRIDYDYCKGCGICVSECPCSAIEYERSATNLH